MIPKDVYRYVILPILGGFPSDFLCKGEKLVTEDFAGCVQCGKKLLNERLRQGKCEHAYLYFRNLKVKNSIYGMAAIKIDLCCGDNCKAKREDKLRERHNNGEKLKKHVAIRWIENTHTYGDDGKPVYDMIIILEVNGNQRRRLGNRFVTKLPSIDFITHRSIPREIWNTVAVKLTKKELEF